MTRVTRALLFVGAGLLALASAPVALAHLGPTFAVSHSPMTLGSAEATTIHVTDPAGMQVVGSVRFVVPRAYGVNLPVPGLSPASGTATALAGEITPEIVHGSVGAWPPATAALIAPECAGTTAHDHAFVVYFPALGWRPRVVLFFDATETGPTASYVGELCLPPVANGMSPVLHDLELTLNGIFSMPAVAGEHVWTAVVTPWSGRLHVDPDYGYAPLDVDRAVLRHARVRLPAGVTLAAVVKNRRIVVSGRVHERGRAVDLALVVVTVAGQRRELRTSQSGNFRAVFTTRRRGRYVVRAEAAVAERSEIDCVGGDSSCEVETLPRWTSTRTVLVRVR